MKLSTEVYTQFVKESKQFYCSYFDFIVKLELDDFVILQHKNRPEYELLFCIPNCPFVEQLFWPAFQGKGILFQIEVADVKSEYKRLQEAGITIKLPLINEPVNGYHFTVEDPNGILIDIVSFNQDAA